MRDPDPVASPLRRTGGALFAGVMLAVLAVAATAVYGLLRPGAGSGWRDGQATIIEKETGARYVYVDGVLHPVLNHTSAMLILGTAATVQVPRSDLLDVPRGVAVGIPGAPDPLPAREQFVDGPWTLCSQPPTPRPGSAAAEPESVLTVDWAPDGPPLEGGVLAVDPTGGWHLLWNGRRYALRDPDLVLAAFAWTEASATPVAAALLNAIPAGPDLAPPAIPRRNEPSAVPGLQVGEVFVVSNPDGNRLFGVAVAEGVRTLTAVQAALLVAAGANGGDPPRDLRPADYAGATNLDSLIPTGDDAPPANTPAQVRPAEQAAICASFTGGVATAVLAVTGAVGPASGQVAPDEVAPRARRIVVPPGRGVLVESLASPGAPSGALAVISDQGVRFAVPSTQVLSMLGLGAVTPVRLPAALVSLVPPGPALDPAAAVLPAA